MTKPPSSTRKGKGGHTPGEWFIRRDKRESTVIRIGSVAKSGAIATIHGGTERMPNARLIAAAPELLAALQALNSGARPVNWDDCDDPGETDAWRQLDAAIARATGAA